MKKALVALFALLASVVSASAQTQPADMGITPTTLPEVLQVLDNTKTWVPIGTVNPTTHTFTPVGGGGGGGGGTAGFQNHAALLAGVTTPTTPQSVSQQGFYASGDGGAATYDWNATSLCSVNAGGGTPTADGFICVLPAGQSNLVAGRYLLRLANGVVDARQLGFSDDGRDNSPIVDAQLAGIIHANPGLPIVFSPNPGSQGTNFYFSKPYDVLADGTISCNDGSRPYTTKVNLIFMPGVPGVRFIGFEGFTRVGYPSYGGTSSATLKGCSIYSLGVGNSHSRSTTVNNPIVPMNQFVFSGFMASGGSQPTTMPKWAVGDSMTMFNGPVYWYFDGYVTPGTTTSSSTLHVTTVPSGGDGSAGIQVGQMLQNGGIPHGFSIMGDATHWKTYCTPNCTGAGGIGTYALSNGLTAPPLEGDAIPAGTIGSSGAPVAFNTEVQSGPPLTPPGTTITGCSTLSGTQCPWSGVATLTLSNAPKASWDYASVALPGPNNAKGSQQFNITSSLTGHTYGPMTASISGQTMTVTSPPSGSPLNLGQVVAGISGAPVTGITTTTSALTLGQTTGIHVSSCAGVAAGMYVVGLHSGNPVFPPETQVANCAGNLLDINIATGNGYTPDTGAHTYYGDAEAGSNVVRVGMPAGIGGLYIGMPAVAVAPTAGYVPAGTTVTGYTFDKGRPGYTDVTLSNNVTTTTDSFLSMDFGGVIDAAPTGTALTFLSGVGTIIEGGTGIGGAGTYTLDQSVTLASNSNLYAYDTPGTIYVTGGPRIIIPQELLWSDAVPWGTISAMIYATSPSRQTVVMSPTLSYGEMSAIAAHTAGSGKMWALPAGVFFQGQSNFENNEVNGFAPGVSMACAATNYRPDSGCGQSYSKGNLIMFNIIGRLVVGNNVGGSAAEFEEYDHNIIADIADISTVGSVYIGEQLQGQDESSNTYIVKQWCASSLPMIGAYASGAGWSSTCAGYNVMDYNQNALASGWSDAVFGAPWNVYYATSAPQPSVSCTGAPTASFEVRGGVVTHC